MAFEKDGIKQLTAEEVQKALENPREDLVFLDVREDEEYEAAHIPGVHLLPTSEFMARYEQELDQNKEYIVICRSGNRSQIVCKFLQEQGFTKLANLAGGMLEWDGAVERGS
jgi:rhodanese-related sulfurtransferase